MINRIDLSGCGRRCRVEQNRASGHAANLKLVGHFINQDEFFISAWFKIPQKQNPPESVGKVKDPINCNCLLSYATWQCSSLLTTDPNELSSDIWHIGYQGNFWTGLKFSIHWHCVYQQVHTKKICSKPKTL